MAAVLGFFLKDPSRIIALVLGLALVGVVLYFKADEALLKHQITTTQAALDAANKKNGQLETVNASLTAANADFKTQVDAQNASIQRLVADAETNQKVYAATLATQKKKADIWKSSFDNLLHAAPPPPEKECEATNKLLGDYIQLRLKEIENEKGSTAVPETPDATPAPGPNGMRDTGDQDGVRADRSQGGGAHAVQTRSVSDAPGVARLRNSGSWVFREGAAGSYRVGGTPHLRYPGSSGVEGVHGAIGTWPCGGDPHKGCGADPNISLQTPSYTLN